MNFNRHFELKGQHAFLSAIKYHWINYTEEKLVDRYENMLAVQRGTELHEFAQQAITYGVKLKNTKQTLNMYVNDAIGFRRIYQMNEIIAEEPDPDEIAHIQDKIITFDKRIEAIKQEM